MLWNARLGVRYHMHQQASYGRLGKFITAFTLLMSSAAFVKVLESETLPDYWAKWLICVAALLQVVELVLDTKSKAVMHATLRQRYLQLELTLSGRDYILESEEMSFKEIQKNIEVDEPPIHESLMDKCHNDLVTINSDNISRDKVQLSIWKRFIARMLS
ncbi:hypothetical protein [Salinivibrio kushneri]|uniref:hypothetical protein n=1 Tax=Salinivibrio kushneri TaxID=1908198 RepID=UPI0022B42DF8|nr:hypothetical protein [Salinivibrio kushneri]WBA13442.1 hypothetical protein O4546_14000 [Salinivibrio kushneri]